MTLVDQKQRRQVEPEDDLQDEDVEMMTNKEFLAYMQKTTNQNIKDIVGELITPIQEQVQSTVVKGEEQAFAEQLSKARATYGEAFDKNGELLIQTSKRIQESGITPSDLFKIVHYEQLKQDVSQNRSVSERPTLTTPRKMASRSKVETGRTGFHERLSAAFDTVERNRM